MVTFRDVAEEGIREKYTGSLHGIGHIEQFLTNSPDRLLRLNKTFHFLYNIL